MHVCLLNNLIERRTSSSGVKAVLYLDVVGPGLVDADITGALKNATNGTTLDLFEVDPSKFHAIHRIVGKLGLIVGLVK